MGYVKDNLMPNEKIFFTARVHPAVFLPSIVVFAMTIALFIYGLSNAAVVSKPGSPPSQVEASNIIGVMLLCFSGLLFLSSILLGIRAAVVMLTNQWC